MDYADKFKQYIEFVKTIGNEGKAHCPFHEGDSTPSLSVNFDTGLWQCFGCGIKGNFETFKKVFKTSIAKQFNKSESIETEISDRVINNFHENLLNNDFVLEYSKINRCWVEEVIKRYKIGWNGYRITIPIRDKHGNYVNIRLYDMLHKYNPSEKVKSFKHNTGGICLWPENLLNEHELLLVEGEPDALLGLSLNLNTITFTTGAAAAAKNVALFAKHFKGKKLYVVYDGDKAGYSASRIISDKLCGIADVYNITLPNNKDFTDYIKDQGLENFKALMLETQQYELNKLNANIDFSKTFDINLSEASAPFYYNKMVSFKCLVSGKDLVPYLIPKKYEIFCETNHTFCKTCPLVIYEGQSSHEINELDPILMELIDVSSKVMDLILKDNLKVPKRCTSFRMSIVEAQNIEELRLIPELTYTSFDTMEEYVVRQAYFCGSNIKSNTSYEFKGTTMPHPKTQHVIHVLNSCNTITDNISNFKIDDDIKHALVKFKDANIDDLLNDLTYNVTKIYERKYLHLMILLTYLSPLSFTFGNKFIRKGWVESLIIGDTRCGKTETVEKLISHFKLGEMATGENVSYAGLVGGIQQVSNRFMISWGKIPLNDRRLLVIDEASSLDVEAIEKLSGIRSSGIAEITKIQAERTFARTRLLWLSNPRSNRPINFYDLGILTVKELIGKPEDVARFDLALIVSSDEVNMEIINKIHDENSYAHNFTNDICHALVMWAWSRKSEQIIFDEGVEQYIAARSLKTSKNYISDISLINFADFRLKLARVAISFATLHASSNSDQFENILTKKEHVDEAINFFTEIYNKQNCGYDIYCQRRYKENTVKDSVDVINTIRLHGKDFAECLADAIYIRVSDIEDFAGIERTNAKAFISFLVKQRAVKRKHSFYIKTPAFITLLKKMLSDKDVNWENYDKENDEI